MKNKFLFMVACLVSLTICACDEEEDSGPRGDTQVIGVEKFSELKGHGYKSENCSAIVSGTDTPMTLSMSYFCETTDTLEPGNYVFDCLSAYACETQVDNRRLEVMISDSFTTIVVVEYTDDALTGTESFDIQPVILK